MIIDWTPIKYRALTEEERDSMDFLGCEKMYDCLLPEDGQEVLITTKYNTVCIDVFCRDGDNECYFETYCDDHDVIAWAELPEPYVGD